VKQIYQCDSGNLTKLCIRDLEAGETNGRLRYKTFRSLKPRATKETAGP